MNSTEFESYSNFVELQYDKKPELGQNFFWFSNINCHIRFDT